jgi:hypothetical protein
MYSPSAMTNAYRAVLEGGVSVKRAALNHGVPQNTLRQRVLGRVNPETVSSGPMPTLNQEEEALFVEHLKSMASLGYGYTSSEVVSMASNYAVYLHKRDPEKPFSMKWFRCFMKRWPELHVIKPRSLANYRAKAASESTVNDYFEKLDHVLTKFDLKDKPHCIYNVDEKGIQTEHSPPYIVSAGQSAPAVTSSKAAITTILGCGNALGTMLPPFYIFKGKRFRDELLDGSNAGSSGTVTESGWSNSAVFLEFLETHFLKYLQRQDPEQTVLLIFDGHKSHINIPVINWAKDHNVELFVLPAHTSHILQPLDVGCFGPLQRIYNSECHKFIRVNPSSQITRYNVAALSSKAYDLALSASNLKSAFRRTGIFPYDPSAIDNEKLTPATAFSAPPPTISTDDHISNPEPEDPSTFFKERTDCIVQKQNFKTKTNNCLSKITSGTSITEPEAIKKIVSHQEKQKRKSNSSSQPSISKKKINTTVTPPTHLTPRPGPSGLQLCPVSDTDSVDSDISEEETCCVCHKFQPDQLKNCISLVFTKWAQCDYNMCKHWTHLTYCCKERVVRRHDKFICPCHSEE